MRMCTCHVALPRRQQHARGRACLPACLPAACLPACLLPACLPASRLPPPPQQQPECGCAMFLPLLACRRHPREDARMCLLQGLRRRRRCCRPNQQGPQATTAPTLCSCLCAVWLVAMLAPLILMGHGPSPMRAVHFWPRHMCRVHAEESAHPDPLPPRMAWHDVPWSWLCGSALLYGPTFEANGAGTSPPVIQLPSHICPRRTPWPVCYTHPARTGAAGGTASSMGVWAYACGTSLAAWFLHAPQQFI